MKLILTGYIAGCLSGLAIYEVSRGEYLQAVASVILAIGLVTLRLDAARAG